MSRTSGQVIGISAIVILAVGLFVASILVVSRQIAARAKASRRGSCEALLTQVQQAMKTYQQDYGSFPPVGGTLHGVKTPVLDPWGRPLVFRHVRTISTDDSSANKVTTWKEYRVHSVGPNGFDEGGEGDDIANGS